jgi:hypothetical protein
VRPGSIAAFIRNRSTSSDKDRIPYQFDLKVGITNTLKTNLILSARDPHNNPYAGQTLNAQLEQATILSGYAIKVVRVDLSYRAVDQNNPRVVSNTKESTRTYRSKIARHSNENQQSDASSLS